MQAMLQMQKIDIKALKDAYERVTGCEHRLDLTSNRTKTARIRSFASIRVIRMFRD